LFPKPNKIAEPTETVVNSRFLGRNATFVDAFICGIPMQAFKFIATKISERMQENVCYHITIMAFYLFAGDCGFQKISVYLESTN